MKNFLSVVNRYKLFLGPFFLTFIFLLPLPQWEADQIFLLYVYSLIIFWWLFTSIPLHISTLTGLLIGHLGGAISWDHTLLAFSHPVIFLFLGGFLMAKALESQKIDQRLALNVMAHPIFSKTPPRLFMSLTILTAFFSFWLSNVTTTAIFLPIALGVFKEFKIEKFSTQSSLLLLICHASTIGGIATPIGTAPNVITLGLIKKFINVQINFAEWVFWMLPLALLSLAILFLIFWPEMKSLQMLENKEHHALKLKSLGPLKSGEKKVLAGFIIAACLWIFPGVIGLILGKEHLLAQKMLDLFPESLVAMAVACSFFFMSNNKGEKVLTWEKASTIDWGTLLLFGSGLALGDSMFDSGIAQKIGTSLGQLGNGTPLIIVSLILTLILTELASNTATVNLIIPVILSLPGTNQFRLGLALGVSMMSNLSFMMPVGTPPNAMVYGTGFISLKKMLSKGFMMNTAHFILILFFTLYLFPRILK